MNLLRVIVLILICTFSTPAYAINYNWPDANNFKYPEYEIQVIKNLQSYIYKMEKVFDDQQATMLLSVDFEFNKFKDKAITVFVLEKLIKFISKESNIDLNNSKVIDDFIAQNENSDDYSDIGIKNKLIVWILLRDQYDKKTKIDFEELKQRRIGILKQITNKNNSYSALTDYLLFNEGPIVLPTASKERIYAEIDKETKFINSYPETELSALAMLDNIRYYMNFSKEYDKGLDLSKKLFDKYINFYTGDSDLYTDVYIDIVYMYYTSNDKENLKNMLPLLSKQSTKANSLRRIYNRHLK